MRPRQGSTPAADQTLLANPVFFGSVGARRPGVTFHMVKIDQPAWGHQLY